MAPASSDEGDRAGARHGLHRDFEAPPQRAVPTDSRARILDCAEVTEFSGRGVGMDIVRRNVSPARRHLIDSRAGIGTTITIRLPLTLAIIRGFAGVDEETHILPLDAVIECIEFPRDGSEEEFASRGVIDLRGQALPHAAARVLPDWWTTDRARERAGASLLRSARRARRGSTVRRNQTVIKPLSRTLGDLPRAGLGHPRQRPRRADSRSRGTPGEALAGGGVQWANKT